MSLNFDLSGIKDFETVCMRIPEDGDTPVPTKECTTVIFTTMTVGLPGFTSEKELDEFYRRLCLYERLFWSQGQPTTKNTLRKYMGLRTNVSKEPTGRWQSRIIQSWHNEREYHEQRALTLERAKAAKAI